MKITSLLRTFIQNILLVLAAALLFALGFPNFISEWGFAPFAWVSLIPVVILIRRVPWWSSPLWGAFYGYVTYTLFNFWLASFNPVSFVLVPVIYAGWFFLFFPLLTLADRAFPRRGWLVQLLVWAAYEVVRTWGFIGYSYGILGYSQYKWRSLIAIADVFGVMGVSLLVAFPSFVLAAWLLRQKPGFLKQSIKNRPERDLLIPAGIWCVLMLAANVYGLVSKVDYSESRRWRPALIQHNINAWLSNMNAWEGGLDALLEQSREALKENPDALIWSETAFVPSVNWHLKYRRERDKVDLINTLTDFMDELEIPAVIGNNDAVRDAGKRIEYNAAILFRNGNIADRYHKIRLVPFSEHFPYAKTFPKLMEYIQEQGTPLYEAGTEFRVFNLGSGPRVGPLICFEDTFGYLARGFVLEGAEVLVNLTNDSWSPQPACAVQHQSIAVFRAVENRRSLVRATTAGLTCLVDPNGRTTEMIEPFTKGYLIPEVPVYTGRTTLYTRYGTWFERLIIIFAVPVLLTGGLLLILRQRSFRKKQEIKKHDRN